MVEAGIVDMPYIDQMIAAIEELGPYIVIALGIALAIAPPLSGSAATRPCHYCAGLHPFLSATRRMIRSG